MQQPYFHTFQPFQRSGWVSIRGSCASVISYRNDGFSQMPRLRDKPDTAARATTKGDLLRPKSARPRIHTPGTSGVSIAPNRRQVQSATRNPDRTPKPSTRTSGHPLWHFRSWWGPRRPSGRPSRTPCPSPARCRRSVSYTHLTLPTILRV